MSFKKYQHLERFGTSEVEGIDDGTCYIFPKLDGTNASVWMSDQGIKAGSRKRELSLESDNAGFYNHIINDENIKNFLNDYPNHYLYGEWLVPHSIKNYSDDAWREFYVFDVIKHEDDVSEYLTYEQYKPILENYNIQYIPLITKIKSPSYEELTEIVKTNNYLMKGGVGEGIVIKRYDYSNKYGRTVWAKIINSEFKQKQKTKNNVMNSNNVLEEQIVDEFVTTALCEKVYSKIENESGWSSQKIPQLLNTVYYDLVREDMWEIVKKYKDPTINFKTLKSLTFKRVKENLSNLI